MPLVRLLAKHRGIQFDFYARRGDLFPVLVEISEGDNAKLGVVNMLNPGLSPCAGVFSWRSEHRTLPLNPAC